MRLYIFKCDFLFLTLNILHTFTFFSEVKSSFYKGAYLHKQRSFEYDYFLILKAVAAFVPQCLGSLNIPSHITPMTLMTMGSLW